MCIRDSYNGVTQRLFAFFFLIFKLFDEHFLMLFAHVLYFYFYELAAAGGKFHCRPWLVCVHMYFYNPVILDDEKRIPESCQLIQKIILMGRIFGMRLFIRSYQKFRAESVFDVLPVSYTYLDVYKRQKPFALAVAKTSMPHASIDGTASLGKLHPSSPHFSHFLHGPLPKHIAL